MNRSLNFIVRSLIVAGLAGYGASAARAGHPNGHSDHHHGPIVHTDTRLRTGFGNGFNNGLFNNGFGGGFGVGGFGLGDSVGDSVGENLPHFALCPPVYYSYAVPRTYGYSPFAYPGFYPTPEVAPEGGVQDIVNPYASPAPVVQPDAVQPQDKTDKNPEKSDDRPRHRVRRTSTNDATTANESKLLVIDNPYVQPAALPVSQVAAAAE